MRQKLMSLLLFLACTPASAETSRGALQGFGLLGTWSVDCSKDVEKEAASRITYAAPMIGAATYTSVNRFTDNRTAFVKMEIENAVRITAEKIQLTANPTEVKRNNDILLLEGDYASKRVIVLEKVGSKVRVFESRSVDGKGAPPIEDGRLPNGNMMPLLEKCLK